MIFGIDVFGLIPALIPLLPSTILGFVPDAFGALGEWGACIAQYGAESPLCQGL
ncbi:MULTISPECIES: hypothetical protein [Antrihabitans]|jgi:hypothetical protein|uniref:Uncharacterized protein n=2 Tax=Antrihabitans TaxID=2799491 RepID=A0A934NRD9_9NOCA|nr:hypothetical protein [Antrihabitans stalagmiti]MBJ8340076.1 hypothetical protein [Antrihabitans stalagmiti]